MLLALLERRDLTACLLAALRVKVRQFDCSVLLAWRLALWSGWQEALRAMSDLQHSSAASLVMLQ